MDFTQKIYYANKPLILTNSASAYMKKHPQAEGYLCFRGATSNNFERAFNHLNEPGTMGAIMIDESLDKLRDELHKLYAPVEAGGGVVFNEDGEVLMIFRRGKWDLPKGKRDDGEDIATCALREVSEETGLAQLVLGDKLCDTYHIYSMGRDNLLKCTAWYKMTGTNADTLEPQAEENIEEVRWVAEGDMAPIAYKTYEAIREVLKEAGVNWE